MRQTSTSDDAAGGPPLMDCRQFHTRKGCVGEQMESAGACAWGLKVEVWTSL